MQLDQQVDVVVDTADAQGGASLVAKESAQVGEHLRANLVHQPGLAVLGGEDEVIEQVGERVRHGCRLQGNCRRAVPRLKQPRDTVIPYPVKASSETPCGCPE